MAGPTTCGQGLAANAELPAALAFVADAMARVLERHMGALDLPMGAHDMAAMMDPANTQAFLRLIDAKRELLALLEVTLEEDEAMLEMMPD